MHHILLLHKVRRVFIECKVVLVIEWMDLVNMPVKIVYKKQPFYIIGFSDSLTLVKILEG